MFLSEKDWENGENIFRHENVSKGILDVKENCIVYVLSGEISLYYIDKNIEISEGEDVRNVIKTCGADDLCCVFDALPVDMFDTDRNMRLHMACTEVNSNTKKAEIISVEFEKLMDFLSIAHLHTLKHLFQVR